LNPALNRNPLTRPAALVTLLIGLGITVLLPVMKTFAAEPAAPQARPQTLAPASVAPVAPAVPAVPAVPSAPVQRQTVGAPQLEIEIPNLELELNKSLKQLANAGPI